MRRAFRVGTAGLLALAVAGGAATLLPDRFAGAGLRPGVDVPREIGPVAPAPLARPAPAPLGRGGYAFLHQQPDGSPVTFDPCRPVHVVVNRDGEPPGATGLLEWALGEVTVATGLQFVLDGSTDERAVEDRDAYQPDRYGDRWAPVLVAWSHVGPTSGAAAQDPEVLGQAGPYAFGTQEPGSLRYVSGTALFNGPAIQGLLDRGREDWVRAVFLHELGHLVGLDHVADPYQVMHDTNVAPLTRYRDGDLRGLEELGRGPCRTDY